MACLVYFITEKKLDIEVKEINGMTPLHRAADELESTSIDFLVAYGA